MRLWPAPAWLVLAAGIVLLAASGPSLPTPQAAAQGGLFTPTGRRPTAPTFAVDGTIVRARYVEVNFALLDSSARAPAATQGPGSALPLDLFPAEAVLFPAISLTVVREGLQPTSSGRGYVWTGKVQGVPDSQVTLVAESGVLVGNIRTPEAYYQVRYAGGGVHAVYEINARAFPEERHDHRPPPRLPAGVASTGSAPRAATDSSAVVDVMVVYTSAARDAAGGTTAMNGLVDLGMVETNQAYANSGVAQRVRLVYRDEVSYAETGNIQVDLERLQEGSIANVHAWRNSYGADIVSLWVENGGLYCGIGYQLVPISAEFNPYAVNVVVRVCATGNYSFAHEMGHNMGACHDRIVNDCQPANGYGYGYIAPGDAFRTIMSYATSCANCSRIQYFSSSTATYQGQPVGVANSMDNRRMLDDTAATVANFRQCTVAPCGVPPTPPATATPVPAPTAVPTATPVPMPRPVPTATPIPTATPLATCSPRPPVALATARYGDRLQVTLTPAGGARLQRVQLGALTNAVVDFDALGRMGVGSGTTITLPPETLSLTLYVRRVVPGQASHVNLTVGDGCGDWPTFVGGGATAF